MFRIKLILIVLVFSIIFSCLLSELSAQDTTSSLAFKRNKPVKRGTLFYQPDLSYQLWKQFNLIREANSGNVLAQHELGIRYLLGDGLPADTLKGAYWIQKAAEKKLPSACYNYGILLLNGWGVNWNPFEAYNYFLTAAKDNMPLAEFIIGILHTDGLVVKKDLVEAYRWVKKASDSGYEQAIKTLTELKEKIPDFMLESEPANMKAKQEYKDENNSLTSTLGLSFIDFESVSDTIKEVTNEMLLKDLLLTGNNSLTDTLTEYHDVLPEVDSSDIPYLLKATDYGTPEALNILGRFYEKGIYYTKDPVSAASYYIRAIRLDSPKALWLLWNLFKNADFINSLKQMVDENNPEAMFVWYGLYLNGYDNRIAQQDALNLIQKSASQEYLPAINELGLVYNNGSIVSKDVDKAIDIWKTAEKLGSKEAGIRLAAAKVFGYLNSSELNSQVEILLDANDLGSILAQVVLAYCYENGIGLSKDKATAAKYYRKSAQRGNRFAFDQLKRMYDELRPNDNKFIIN